MVSPFICIYEIFYRSCLLRNDSHQVFYPHMQDTVTLWQSSLCLYYMNGTFDLDWIVTSGLLACFMHIFTLQ